MLLLCVIILILVQKLWLLFINIVETFYAPLFGLNSGALVSNKYFIITVIYLRYTWQEYCIKRRFPVLTTGSHCQICLVFFSQFKNNNNNPSLLNQLWIISYWKSSSILSFSSITRSVKNEFIEQNFFSNKCFINENFRNFKDCSTHCS